MSIPALDAHYLARVLSACEEEGEAAALTGPYATIIQDLASLPPDARAAHYEAWKDGRDDADELDRAILRADPLGSPPDDVLSETSETRCDDWEPIRLGVLPEVELFPLDVLPLPARDFAEAVARSVSCPVDYPAVAILAAASGLIGHSTSLLIKPGYFAPASLYAAIVGGASAGKSPALRAALAPLSCVAQELHEEWRQEMDSWNETAKEEKGPKPNPRRIMTTDPTTEALGPILRDNPRGLTLTPDEMTKWVLSMDQYKAGRGGDRPFYLSAWAGEAVFIDRAKNMGEPIAVPHPFLTVIGGMTPGMLSTLPEGRGRDDGFIARLLFSFPDPPRRVYSEEGVPDAVASSWADLARSLWLRPMRDQDGKLCPRVVYMADDAKREWAEWCRAHYKEQEADGFSDDLEGPWGKLEAYAARLALILHLLELAADPTGKNPDDPPDLHRRTITDAARLITYFKSHCLRVQAAMGDRCDDGGDDVRALLRWIVRNNLDSFSTRDIDRNFNRFKHDEASRDDALAWLTDHNIIKPQSPPPSPGRSGRKPAPAYDVNPDLRNNPRFRRFRQNPAQ